MALMTRLGAMIRGLVAPSHPEAREDAPLMMNARGDLIVAQALPELAEIVRMGYSYQVAGAAGIAALTALPTTVAGLSLFNGETGKTPKAYVIDAFGSTEEVVDATQTDVTAVFALNNKVSSITTPPTDAALAIRSLSGRGAYAGRARTVAGATVVNDGWFAHGTSGQMAAAVAGANWKVNEVLCRGLYVVPPGGQFNVVAVKAAAAAALQQFYFVRWHEVLIDVLP